MSSRRRWNPEFRGRTMTWLRFGLPRTTGAAAGSTTYAMCASGYRRRNARIRGVVNTTSPKRRRRSSSIFINLRPWGLIPEAWGLVLLYGGLVNKHHRDVVFDRVYTMALVGFEGGVVLDQPDGRPAIGACEDFEQFGVYGHGASRGTARRSRNETGRAVPSGQRWHECDTNALTTIAKKTNFGALVSRPVETSRTITS